MTVQEIMERVGTKDTTLAIAWIKDAIHLIQSNYDEGLKSWKQDVTDGTLSYDFPSDMIKLKSISILDTNDDKYKKIKRLVHESIVTEDTEPE